MSPRRSITLNKLSRTIALAIKLRPAAVAAAAIAVAAVLLAAPTGGQVADPAPPRAPKSLLPDSFGPAVPAVVTPTAPRPAGPVASGVPGGDATAPPPTTGTGALTTSGTDTRVRSGTAAAVAPGAVATTTAGTGASATTGTVAAATTGTVALPGLSVLLPAATGPAVDLAGPLTPELGGYGPAAFAGSDGRFVDGLLRRLTTPIASRWAHIVLRRALSTRAVAPAGVNPGDWIADRARVLLGLGEVDAAKALLDNLPVDRMTPRLIRVTGQVSLAAADLPGLCPVADVGGAVSPDPVWRLAEAMCAALAGDDISGASRFDALRASGRDRGTVDPFDVQLGERVATISGGGGRAANIDWDAAGTVTPFRFGVAAAAGVAVPLARLTELAAATGGSSWGWVLRAPSQSPDARAAALRPAAALGIASADDMVAAVATASADLDRSALDASPAGTLRDAYAAATTVARVAAMRTIWTSGATEPDHYAAHLETGIAAARLPVDRAVAADAPELIAAMLAAGIEDRAARWWPVVARGDDAAARAAWALLAVGANGGIAVSPARFAAYANDVSPHRAALLLAALRGLGNAQSNDWQTARGESGQVDVVNSWTRAIDAAGRAQRVGEVAVLAATGLQTRWAGVPPAHLFHIVAALVAAGRGHEARMIAAEAVSRG